MDEKIWGYSRCQAEFVCSNVQERMLDMRDLFDAAGPRFRPRLTFKNLCSDVNQSVKEKKPFQKQNIYYVNFLLDSRTLQ